MGNKGLEAEPEPEAPPVVETTPKKAKGKSKEGAVTDGKKVDVAGSVGDITKRNKKKADYQMSTDCLDFGLLNLNERKNLSLGIRNNTQKKMKWKIEPPPSEAYDLSFKPAGGGLAPSKDVMIMCSFLLKDQASLNFRVNVRIDGGRETLFLNVRAHADQGVFGVDPLTLELEDDHGYRIPKVLKQMRTHIYENDGWTQEGIFRLAGDASNMKAVKATMNQSKSYPSSAVDDVNTTSNLLKVWFRDLPTPILNALDTQTIFKSSDPEMCCTAYFRLPEPQKTLMGWLLDMLAEVSKNREQNKMSAQNLAIVVAPNLYEPPGSDPMEGLVMSQKCVQFLHNLLLQKIDGSLDGDGAGAAGDAPPMPEREDDEIEMVGGEEEDEEEEEEEEEEGEEDDDDE